MREKCRSGFEVGRRDLYARAMRFVLASILLFAVLAHADDPAPPVAPPPIPNPGWLGLRLEPATPEEQKSLGVDRPVPRVGKVFGASPALAAGVQAGDFVLAFQDQDIADVRDLVTRVGTTPAGSAVTFKLQRGKERLEKSVTLAARPDQMALLRGEWMGKPLPTLSLANAGGEGRFDLSQGAFKGKVLLIDYFATWCGPCRILAQKLHPLLERERPNGFEIVSISTEELDVVKAWVAKNAPGYPILVDDNHSFEEAFSPSVMPTVWIIDREGQVRGVWSGANEYAAMEKKILELLGPKDAPLTP